MHSARDNRRLRIVLWLVCSVGLAFLPIGVSLAYLDSHDEDFSHVTLFARGEAFLIASTLTADAIGRAFLGGPSKKNFRIACGIGCLVLLLATGSYFGIVSADLEFRRRQIDLAAKQGDGAAVIRLWSQPPYDQKRVANVSLIMLGLTVLAALGIIVVEED